MNFEDLKAEYSKQETTNKRKGELILLMQECLKSICDKDPVKCLDGNTYSTSSEKVEDLYAIYGALKLKKSQAKMSDIGNSARHKSFEQNKFGPENQYPESK